MTTEAVQYSKEQSTDIVYKKKKRLAKSGKDRVSMEGNKVSCGRGGVLTKYVCL